MKKLFYLTLNIFCFLSLNSLAANSIKGAVSLEGETFNFELSGQKNWDYDLKRVNEKGQSKVLLFVKSLDQDFIDKIRNVENPYVQSINVTKNAIDNKWLVEFNLKNNQVETFDYLTDQPSKLIIDFYKSEDVVNEVKLNAEVKVKSETSAKKEKSHSLKKVAAKNSTNQRKPAQADVLTVNNENVPSIEGSILAKAGLYDAGDAQFTRFAMNESDYKEESVIRSRGNYYLKFPVLESEFSFWKKMKENPPDYQVKTENNEENKQFRLLKTLFSKKRYLVYLQTAEWFKNKFPNSKYLEMLSFMMADAYVELWKAEKIDSFYEQAQNAYREALEQYPNSELAERTSLLSGMLAIDRTDYMSSIRKLQAHIDNKKYDNKISKQYAMIGLAYSYSKINKVEDGLKYLTEIEKSTKDEHVLTEVAVRRGDFYFNSKKLSDAIKTYEEAIKKFPMVEKSYPSAFFNKMEAQFWLSQFKESHKSALGFAQYFPSHEFAPYALTRVGELIEIMGGDLSKSVGAYLETHFRYGDSPKTIIARLHLLSTRMKSMKVEELEQTLAKMDELALKSELENVDQFKVAMVADGFSRRQEYLKAIDILSKFYQSNPTRRDAKQVTQRIAKNISDQLKLLSDQGDYKQLLKTYQQYSDTWLKTYPRIDTDYFLGLSYESAGVYGDAIAKYKKVLADLYLLKGTALEKETHVNQYLPSFESLYLKLAKNSFENLSFQDSYQYLVKIEKPLNLADEEQIQRVQLAASLYDKKGDKQTAIRYLSELSQVWYGKDHLTIPVLLQLADLQISENKEADAIITYEQSREILFNSKKPIEKDFKKLLNSYSALLVKQGKLNEAITFLNEAFVKHGNKYNLNQERYYLGNLYYEKGELKKAEGAWANLKDEGSNLWKKLSQEKLRQASWDIEYKKHLKRIPAMSQLGEQQ